MGPQPADTLRHGELGAPRVRFSCLRARGAEFTTPSYFDEIDKMTDPDESPTPPTPFVESLRTGYKFLAGAKKVLDHQFGDDYADKHPELVAALMFTAALNYHARTHADCMAAIAEAIAQAKEP